MCVHMCTNTQIYHKELAYISVEVKIVQDLPSAKQRSRKAKDIIEPSFNRWRSEGANSVKSQFIDKIRQDVPA